MDTLHDNTLALAESLLKGEAFGDAAARRAVSSAYYAVFQRLSSLCAARLSGQDSRSEDYQRLYRALDHKPARAVLKRPGYVAELGNRFERLQEARHWADYSIEPFHHHFAAPGVSAAGPQAAGPQAYVDMARDALEFIASLDSSAQLKLATLLIVRDR